MNISIQKLKDLNTTLKGSLFFDKKMRHIYATDASVYRMLPLAVAYPKDKDDIRKLIDFARQEKTSLIPRAAGTSLAGQCVGKGVVVDVSKHMNNVLEINKQDAWVRVQPGVVRDVLNHKLKPYGLFFGPNTSTANRATIGGMVGNNSCGSYSIVYGDTRKHTLEIKAILSDGSEVLFSNQTLSKFRKKGIGSLLENKLYRQIAFELGHPINQREIRRQFPKKSVTRRNTGYALDELLDSAVFEGETAPFNFCKLIAGSEGTLCFITEIKIHLDPLPPPAQALVCVHHKSIDEALRAVLVAMEHKPRAVELMDKIIMEMSKKNKAQEKNRFFIHGDPEAILAIELAAENEQEIEQMAQALIDDLKTHNFGYHFPVVYPPDIKKVWELRKAGLGLLANIPGDAKAVAVIEDTAVDIKDLPAYIKEFTENMERYKQTCVYYAHAGAGELHLRPVLDLKTSQGVNMFRDIGTSTAKLVKKYNGSLSGEHGDGLVRAEFIPLMVGEKNYALFKRIKDVWDPQNIFNPGKIVDAPPMDTSLRYETDKKTVELSTLMDFSDTQGYLRAAEKCNGSGDCRKMPVSGGTMCPSYMATQNEQATTRARANILREILTHSDKINKFDSKEIYDVLDLCLSCKGCKTECPSNVDMATLKTEFLYQYQKAHGIPMRSKAIANIGKVNNLASLIPSLSNFGLSNFATSKMIKKLLGIAPLRSMPLLHTTTLKKWFKQNKVKLQNQHSTPKGKVYLFCDEFTNFNDTHIGIQTIQLLYKLGYQVDIPLHTESARAYISKGLLKEAKKMANKNVRLLKNIVSEKTPLIGIEPSAIYSFRDEYPRLVDAPLRQVATELGKHAMLIDDFLDREIHTGNISSTSFNSNIANIQLHGHCHQKALGNISTSVNILSLPQNYTVRVIPSGCCGMAGSFGYEAEHYDVSMRIGEMVLFPAVRKAHKTNIIAAPGTSCRHQILDGTGVKALHPIEILYQALKN